MRLALLHHEATVFRDTLDGDRDRLPESCLSVGRRCKELPAEAENDGALGGVDAAGSGVGFHRHGVCIFLLERWGDSGEGLSPPDESILYR